MSFETFIESCTETSTTNWSPQPGSNPKGYVSKYVRLAILWSFTVILPLIENKHSRLSVCSTSLEHSNLFNFFLRWCFSSWEHENKNVFSLFYRVPLFTIVLYAGKICFLLSLVVLNGTKSGRSEEQFSAKFIDAEVKLIVSRQGAASAIPLSPAIGTKTCDSFTLENTGTKGAVHRNVLIAIRENFIRSFFHQLSKWVDCKNGR